MEEFKYPVPLRTLKKWKENHLEKEIMENGSIHYKYKYEGSSCNNGGLPFHAVIHGILSSDDSPIIEKAWIEIPEEEKESASKMCAALGSSEKSEQFFDSLARDAGFTSQPLEDEIMKDLPLNYAGCFCSQPQRNQKWKMALATMHFDLKGE